MFCIPLHSLNLFFFSQRHVGDLGNVVKDPYGNVQGAIFDTLASLVGPTSVINRGVVVGYQMITLTLFQII